MTPRLGRSGLSVHGCLWGSSPENLTLSNRDVHVWCGYLDQPPVHIQRLVQILSKDERARAKRFYFEEDRIRYIVRHGQLRAILGCYLGIEPGELRFHYSRHGKPALAQAFNEGMLYFSVSHSHKLALYAVTLERNVGVDLEYIRPISDAEQIVEQYFSDREKAAFRTIPSSQKLEAFFNGWTRKEAYLKATGDGLSRPLDKFAVSLASGEAAKLIYVEGDRQEVPRWSLRALVPALGYVGTLVVEGHEWGLSCWQWGSKFGKQKCRSSP